MHAMHKTSPKFHAVTSSSTDQIKMCLKSIQSQHEINDLSVKFLLPKKENINSNIKHQKSLKYCRHETLRLTLQKWT